MCTNVTSERLIADRDIPCYIVAVKSDTFDIEEKFHTLYRHVRLDNKMKSVLETPNSDNVINYGLHSFQNLSDAEKHYDFLRWSTCELKIFYCVIPEGSEYYKGIWIEHHWDGSGDKKLDAYVSNKRNTIEEENYKHLIIK